MKAARARAARVSLRLKLTLGYALIFCVTALVFALSVFVVVRRELQAALDADLRTTAALAQTSLAGAPGRPRLSSTLKRSPETALELLGPQGQVLDQVGEVEDGRPAVFDPTPGFFSTAERRLYLARVPAGYLRVSRPSDALAEVLETLGRVMLLGALLLVLVACLAGYWLADRALRPVDRVARTARRIARGGAYRERVASAPGGDEMARLTLTVNEMLDRLEDTIEREKSFARTAAHELRTPLTALRGRLELTLERPREAQADERALRALLERTEALITLSEALLTLARTEAPVRLGAVELGGVALEAAEQCGDGAGVQLDVTETWVQAEAAGVRQLTLNLLDNARKYGAAPIRLSVRAGELRVHDAGAGPPPDEWARLTRPFERGLGHQGVVGSGLGLALVTALAGRWGASVTPQWGPDGFEVGVRWPTGAGPHTSGTGETRRGQANHMTRVEWH